MTGDRAFADPTHGFWFKVLSNGTSFGNTDPVIEVIRSMLADGDRVRITRWGNREIPLRVEINGPDLASVAHGEAALRGELAKGNVLTWQAPDLFAVPTAYDVVTSWASQNFDDMGELRQVRTFDLTLTCSPFARSVNLTTVPPLTLGAYAPTLIDACNSANGWSATVNGAAVTPVVSSGVVTATDATSPYRVELTRTGTVDFTSTRYLVSEVSGTEMVEVYATVGGSVVKLPIVASLILTSGLRQLVHDTSGVSTSALRWVGSKSLLFAGSLTFGVANVERSATPPQVSPRQVSRIIAPGGTERTPTSIHVASANGTDLLGLTLVHTSPEDGSGYSPPMRRLRFSGNTVTDDPTAMSGSYEPLHPNPVRYDAPTSALPEGGYLLCAFVRVGLAGTYAVDFSAVTQLPPPNAGVEMGAVFNTTRVTFPVAHTWVLVPLGIMSLPTVRTSAGTVAVRIIRNIAESVDMLIDEAWLFRVDDDCSLTIANATATNLWLDSPSADFVVPTVWMGNSLESRTHPGENLIAQGNHVLQSNGTAVSVSTLGTVRPNVDAQFYRNWHSNAAD